MSKTTIEFKCVLLLLAALFCGCTLFPSDQVRAPRPRAVPPQEVAKIIRAIPSYTRFGYSGLSFFNKKLYATSNIGLLEIEAGTLTSLLKWGDNDDVVSGPWLDIAGKSLWIKHEGMGKLARYDGTGWELVALPLPKNGYSRGDVLAGFRGVGTSGGFWLEGGGHAWRWVGGNSAWEPVSIPPDSFLARIIPLPNRTLLVMQHEFLSFLVKGDDFKSDTIHYYDGELKEVPNQTGKSFFAEEVVIVKDVAYVLTRSGVILRITPSEIVKLDAPESCEAIVATTTGSLLASFRNSGVYEYTDRWQKRFACPYPAAEGEHWSYLAESDGQVAFAIKSKPQADGDNWAYPGQTTLWVAEGSELKPVTIGK